MSKVKIGVLGAGHLGKIHIRLLKDIPSFDFVGFFDPDANNAKQVQEEHGVQAFDTMDALIDAVEAVDIVTPTLSHFNCAQQAIKKSRHIFIEKPLANSVEEARQLVELVEEADIIAQVGHVERFNPALIAIKDVSLEPMFIETHRLAQFNPRGTDVSVVMDLMIHDIDIIRSIVKANVKKISASGVPIISESPDIANARIEFDNGAVANVTASRISVKNMRKMRVFQRDAYISVDFLKKKSEIVTLHESAGESADNYIPLDIGDGKSKFIHFQSPEVPEVNSIKMELEHFHAAIRKEAEIPVTIHDGYQAMVIADQILEKIHKNNIT